MCDYHWEHSTWISSPVQRSFLKHEQQSKVNVSWCTWSRHVAWPLNTHKQLVLILWKHRFALKCSSGYHGHKCLDETLKGRKIFCVFSLFLAEYVLFQKALWSRHISPVHIADVSKCSESIPIHVCHRPVWAAHFVFPAFISALMWWDRSSRIMDQNSKRRKMSIFLGPIYKNVWPVNLFQHFWKWEELTGMTPS